MISSFGIHPDSGSFLVMLFLGSPSRVPAVLDVMFLVNYVAFFFINKRVVFVYPVSDIMRNYKQFFDFCISFFCFVLGMLCVFVHRLNDISTPNFTHI
jgi:hypothetical protein